MIIHAHTKLSFKLHRKNFYGTQSFLPKPNIPFGMDSEAFILFGIGTSR